MGTDQAVKKISSDFLNNLTRTLTTVERSLPSYVSGSELEQKLGTNQVYALEKKYLRRDDDGHITENVPEAIYRMASTMASVESQYGASPEDVERFTEDFYHMIEEGNFSPAGRIWTNAGTQIKGLFNCYVLPVADSMDLEDADSIYMSLARAAVIHKNGGGTGYNFSNLRPRGYFVQASKGIASGPVSFIGQFDKETEIINSGNRRGANMGILNVNHPDILDFITAKAARGKITNFNVSVGATEEFMKAAEADEFYTLQFPAGKPFRYETLERIVDNISTYKIGGSGVGEEPEPASLKLISTAPGKTSVIDSYTGRIAGRVNEEGHVQLSAKYVMDVISDLAWKTADPGMIFLDEVNRFNALPQLGPIMATNPCGEQPLHPYDACNLGSILVNNMIKTNSDGRKEVDYEKLDRTTRLATRFMDNVNDANRGPIPEVQETILRHRRIGMGVMGWADMLIEMGISYDGEEGRNLARQVMGFITDTAKDESVKLASVKGVFPAFEGSKYDNGKLEDRVRNLERTTIAPTGTISMVYEVSSGIEPLFSITYKKNIRGGDTLLYTNKAFVGEAQKRGLDMDKLAKLIEGNHGSVQGLSEVPEDMQKIFKISHDLDYKAHVLMQAAFQEKTDNAVSKTINMPNDATIDDVRNAYFMAWKHKLKGITVYRDGSKAIQVLETGHGKKRNLEEMVMEVLGKPRPEIVEGRTVKIKTPYHQNAFITLNREINGDGKGRHYESFIGVGKAGGDLPAISEGYGRLISMALKAGVSPSYIIEQLEGLGGETQEGIGPNKVRSLPDAIAQGLKKILESEGYKSNGENHSSGNLCPDCGRPLIMEEGCQKCHACGFSKC
ncbi:MAG: adenosylcobalamin-dependent ribonucleoside-diphosphate reductase [Nanoarchaeota archaeon]|nr:adenosylcobalamin-dependent ribonucleoside-diphosphate reductase [Nanoarchaeota archaeon]